MEQDILGPGFERQTLYLPPDDEGPVVATLVRHTARTPTDRAVLYVHGYSDYFFQEHLAEYYTERGFTFYALDLRKHGRSLLAHQTPNFARNLREYFPEIDAAAHIIRERDGHSRLLLNAHSTGGLTAALWAHDRRQAGLVDALFLNSPFFDFPVGRAARRILGPTYTTIGRWRPYARVPTKTTTVYGESIRSDHHGEWEFDDAWKPLHGFVPRAAWISAIRCGHAELHAGLDINVPILVGCSRHSSRPPTWTDLARSTDVVLDVSDIARWSPQLGTHVTIIRITDGLHDLTLSAREPRQRLFTALDRWLDAHVPARKPPTTASDPRKSPTTTLA